MYIKSKCYTQDDKEFEGILDELEKEYFHNGGDEEAKYSYI